MLDILTIGFCFKLFDTVDGIKNKSLHLMRKSECAVGLQ